MSRHKKFCVARKQKYTRQVVFGLIRSFIFFFSCCLPGYGKLHLVGVMTWQVVVRLRTGGTLTHIEVGIPTMKKFVGTGGAGGTARTPGQRPNLVTWLCHGFWVLTYLTFSLVGDRTLSINNEMTALPSQLSVKKRDAFFSSIRQLGADDPPMLTKTLSRSVYLLWPSNPTAVYPTYLPMRIGLSCNCQKSSARTGPTCCCVINASSTHWPIPVSTVIGHFAKLLQVVSVQWTILRYLRLGSAGISGASTS